MIDLALNDLMKLAERAIRDLSKLKKNKTLSYCCINQKTIFLVSQIMLMLLSSGEDARITITLKDGEGK